MSTQLLALGKSSRRDMHAKLEGMINCLINWIFIPQPDHQSYKPWKKSYAQLLKKTKWTDMHPKMEAHKRNIATKKGRKRGGVSLKSQQLIHIIPQWGNGMGFGRINLATNIPTIFFPHQKSLNLQKSKITGEI